MSREIIALTSSVRMIGVVAGCCSREVQGGVVEAHQGAVVVAVAVAVAAAG